MAITNRSLLGLHFIDIYKHLINIANELSHDSGEVFSKEEVIVFWKEINNLLEQIKQILLNPETPDNAYLEKQCQNFFSPGTN